MIILSQNKGKLLLDLTEKEKKILDNFEGVEEGHYSFQSVMVDILGPKIQQKQCFTYVFCHPELFESFEWDEAKFLRNN